MTSSGMWRLVGLVPRSCIFSNQKTEATRSSETLVLTRPTRRNIPEDGILYSHLREKPQILQLVQKCIGVSSV
jgi:hypothetical protein